MKKIFKNFMVLAITSTIISCSNSSNTNTTDNTINGFNELEKASWLIGEWQNNSPEGNVMEVWEKKNDSTFAGKSYFVVGKDTVSSEIISLEQNGKELFYIPTVKDQNNEQPIKFALTSSASGQLVFENPKHDFPQKISYTQITKDSLLAEISGTIDGKHNLQKFPMTRVKK
jgi:sarcosine oxidase delta subunit